MVAEDGTKTKHGHIRDYIKTTRVCRLRFTPYNEKEDFWVRHFRHHHLFQIPDHQQNPYPRIRTATIPSSVYDILKGTDTIGYSTSILILWFNTPISNTSIVLPSRKKKPLRNQRSILGKFKRVPETAGTGRPHPGRTRSSPLPRDLNRRFRRPQQLRLPLAVICKTRL